MQSSRCDLAAVRDVHTGNAQGPLARTPLGTRESFEQVTPAESATEVAGPSRRRVTQRE